MSDFFEVKKRGCKLYYDYQALLIENGNGQYSIVR